MLLISLIQVTESISGSVVPLAMFTLTFVRTKVLSLTYSTGRECPLHNFVNSTLCKYKFVQCSYIFAIRFCCFLVELRKVQMCKNQICNKRYMYVCIFKNLANLVNLVHLLNLINLCNWVHLPNLVL